MLTARPSTAPAVGRAWPLLTGERAHYELAAGRTDVADELAQAMETFAGDSGLLPEQIWDSADIPGRDCRWDTHPAPQCRSCGHTPSTSSCAGRSGMARSSIGLRRPFNAISSRRPRHALRGASTTRFAPCRRGGSSVSKRAAAVVHWSVDGWRTVHDMPTRDTTLGVHVVDLETQGLPLVRSSTLRFTGWMRADGKESISGSALNRRENRKVRPL